MPHNDPAWPLRRFRMPLVDDALHPGSAAGFRLSINFGSEVRFESKLHGHRHKVVFKRHGALLLPGALAPELRRLEGHAYGPRGDGKQLFAKMLLVEVHPAIFDAAAQALAWPAGALERLGPLVFVMDGLALRLADTLRAALTGGQGQQPKLLAPITEAMARWLLLQSAGASTLHPLPESATSPRDRDALMRRVIERIEAELDQKLPLQSLADGAGMSRSHFLRAFKRHTGLTPHHYVVRARIVRAQHLMQTAVDDGREVRLGMVAHDAGFASHSQFSAVFRERVGVSPSDWLDHAQRSCALAAATRE